MITTVDVETTFDVDDEKKGGVEGTRKKVKFVQKSKMMFDDVHDV